MKVRRFVGVALAVGLPLAAVGYLGWVYYSTNAEIDRRSMSGTGSDTTNPWFGSDPVDPADLHGTWTSWAEAPGGGNRRESVVDFQPDGKLVWTLWVTVKDRSPPIVTRYEYTFGLGRLLGLTLTEHTVDGKALALQDKDRVPKIWKLDWKADDKSVFQLRTDPRDEGRPHLLFRKSPPEGGKKD